MTDRATAIKIEKGIPFHKDPASANYPFGDMESGDSFAIPGIEAQTVRLAITYQHKKTKRRFKTRTQPDGTLRVWRVS